MLPKPIIEAPLGVLPINGSSAMVISGHIALLWSLVDLNRLGAINISLLWSEDKAFPHIRRHSRKTVFHNLASYLVEEGVTSQR